MRRLRSFLSVFSLITAGFILLLGIVEFLL